MAEAEIPGVEPGDGGFGDVEADVLRLTADQARARLAGGERLIAR